MMPSSAAGSRRRAWQQAASFGFLYGAMQAILPPLGGLSFSFLLHVALLVTFLVLAVRRRRRRPAFVAFGAYALTLVLAVFLPFKFMDQRIQLDAQTVSLEEIRVALELEELEVGTAEEPLPARSIQLATTRPSLNQLREALNQQTNFDLSPVTECGNDLSITFLWGMRSPATHLFLYDLQNRQRPTMAVILREIMGTVRELIG